MTESDTSGFGKFVPGFDFLQNLAKGAGAMPQLGHWVAPTLSVEDLEKRIGELKNVQFWLEQNSRALAATVQALEVQKMTLAALKGMNFNIAAMVSGQSAAQPAPAAAAAAAPAEPEPADPAPSEDRPAAAGLVEPLQLWGALTQQFQQIAASALKEVGSKAAEAMARPAQPAGAAGKGPGLRAAKSAQKAAKKGGSKSAGAGTMAAPKKTATRARKPQ
jgi:hypothetical protein